MSIQYDSVLQSTTPTERCESSTTPYYKVLLRQNDVHPVLLRTTKYYSRTTSLYYKVLHQDYYKVLLQYYSVLQRTTKYYSDRTTSIQYYSGLQRATERRPSSTLEVKIDDLLRVFLIRSILQKSKRMTFVMLSPLFEHITKCCPCHDF